MKAVGPYCLDTNVIIWGIKKESSAGQEHMIPLVRNFLDELSASGATVILPAIAVGESIVHMESDAIRQEFVQQLKESFLIVPFDEKAAVEFARVWNELYADGTVEEMREKDPCYSRNKLKADVLITATAIAYEARYMVTHDPGLQKTCSKWMRPIPIEAGRFMFDH